MSEMFLLLHGSGPDIAAPDIATMGAQSLILDDRVEA